MGGRQCVQARAARLPRQPPGQAGSALALRGRHLRGHFGGEVVLLLFHAFAEGELAQREAAGFPPFAHLALLRAEAQHADAPMQFLQAAKTALLPWVAAKPARGTVATLTLDTPSATTSPSTSTAKTFELLRE